MYNKKIKSIIYLVVLLLVMGLTIGFSTFQNELYINDLMLKIRLQKDVRVSESTISKTSGAIVNDQEYNKTKLLGNVTFDSTSSYVLYKVDLTNYGNVKSGLLNINSNTSGINYSICDSNGNNCSNNLETPICNGSNCTLGATKEVYVKVTSTTSGTKNIDLDLDIESYVNISYDNIRENISGFKTEALETSSYQVTLTSKPEEVEVSGTATVSYNKTTGVLVLSNIESDLTIQGKYLINTIAEESYSGADPDNYVRFNDTLFRIVTKENVDDGYGNTELRIKLVKDESIGNHIYDQSSSLFSISSLYQYLNEDYYETLNETAKGLIDTVELGKNLINNVVIVSSEDYTANSTWLNKESFALGLCDDTLIENAVSKITSSGITCVTPNTSLPTYPSVYLINGTLIVGGSGTRSNPYLLEKLGNTQQSNPTVISGRSLTVNGSNQNLVTVTNKVGTPYYSVGTALNGSNYTTSGSTTIPSRSSATSYTIYYYIPAGSGYKAKSGSVTSTINPLTFTVAYQKGTNVSAIGKTSDSCTTSGSNLTCTVTLPSITPNSGYEGGVWSDGTNTYSVGASYTLSSNDKTLTASVTGRTYVATFNKNGATSIGSDTLSCTVTTGSSCTVTAPSITRSGYTIVGWNTSASAQTGTAVNSSITLTGNATYNAITKKNITITFNKNGNTSQTVSGGTASTNNTVTQTCTMWNTASNCSITSPTITPASGFTVIGYSEGETNRTNAWTQNTSKNVNSDKTYYAQSSKAGVTRTITFYKNNAKSFTYSGTKYTDISKTFDACNISTVYNGATQSSSCTATINMPTIEVDTGYTENGWGTSASATTPTYTSGQTNASVTMNSNKQFYALRTTNSLTFANQTITKTYSTSSQTATVTAASNGTGTYTYEEKSEKNSGGTNTNYISLSGTTITIAANTPANTYTYVITATDTNSGATKDATYTITINQKKATLGLTQTSLGLTYKTAQTLDYTYDGDGTVSCQSADTSYVTCSVNTSTKKLTITPVKATSSAITVTLKAAAGSNYSAADNKTVSVTVAKFTPTVSLTAKSEAQRTFTGSAITANTATVTLTNSETYSGTINYKYYTNNGCTAGETSTAPTFGNYWAQASITAQGNYNAAKSACVNHNIVAATPTVTLTAKTEAQRTYTGSPIVANTATVSPNGGGTITYKYYTNSACSAGETETAPTNVGTYYAKASVSAVSGKTNAASSGCVNHSIVRASSSLSINPTSGTLTYGTNATSTITKTGDGTLSCSSSDETVAKCSISGTTLTIIPQTVSADNKTATITVSLSQGSNYNAASNVTYSATVNRKVLTCPSSPSDKTYNGSTQTSGISCPTGSTAGGTQSAKNASSTAYTQSCTANNGYKFASACNVSWKINPKALTSTQITAYSTSIVSGATTYTRSVSTVVGSETVSLTYTPYTNAVGSYTYATSSGSGKFTLSQNNTNYSISSAGNFTLSINAATLNMTNSSVALTYKTSGTNTYTYNGDGNVTCSSGDTSYVTCSVNTSTKTITVVPVKATSSAITITVNASAGSIYGATSTTFSVTVAKFTPTVSLSAKTEAQRTYTGSAITANTATVTLTNSETYSGTINYKYYTNNGCTAGETSTAPTFGNYWAQASITAQGNYNAAKSACVNHNIVAATPTVTLTAKTEAQRTYTGSPIVANTATVSPNGGGTITYKYYTNSACSAGETETAPTNVGTYYAKASVSAVSGKTNAASSGCVNHSIVRASSSLSINPTSGTLTYGTNATSTITKTGDGTLSCSSSDETVAKCSISGTTLTIIPQAVSADNKTATITVSLSQGSNYNAASNVTYSATVNRKKTTVTGTFHYNSNTTSGSFTDATKTATCTYYNDATSCTLTVSTEVTSSVGKYNSAYKGISRTTGNMTAGSLTVSANQTFYAFYSSPITIYYPNTSNAVTSNNTALYRNEYYSSATAMNTLTATTQTSTTQATTVTLSSIKGTFQGINSVVNSTTRYAVNDATNVINKDTKTFYAVTTASENVTFKYNSNTTCGSATIATATSPTTITYYCTSTSAMGTSHGTTTTVPSAVSSSKGQYNSNYRTVANVNSLTAVTTFTGGQTYYAVYSGNVTNYYYASSYTNRALYRNEYLASDSATTYTAKLATSNTGMNDYTTAVGPGSSVWAGLSIGQDTTAEYSSVSAAATSSTCASTLYTVYQFNVTYEKGSNVNAIGATSGSCKITTSSTSCTVTLPTITPNTGYTAVGWNITKDATSGTASGQNYTISTNNTKLYGNVMLGNYQNITTSTFYQTLSEALNDVASNQTIKVLKNTTESSSGILAAGKTGVKLNLNGKTITSSAWPIIANSGTLDIYSSLINAALIGTNEYAITNSSVLTINKTISNYNITISATNNTIYNTSGEANSITINKATISGTTGIYNNGTGGITINNSSISALSYGLYNMKSGYIQSTNTNIDSVNAIAAYNDNTGSITIDGGTLTAPLMGAQNFGAGTLTILNGDISGGNVGAYNSASGTLTVGTNDSSVSPTVPSIQATGTSNKYGVQNAGGTFNFYDGVIKSSSGSGYSINGTVTSTPTNYYVMKTINSGVESAYLMSNYTNTSTNISYSTLNSAFSNVQNNQTIKVNSSATETQDATLPRGVTGIKLDLNGKTITLDSSIIKVIGELDIYNTSSTDGSIESVSATLIQVTGSLSINETSQTNKVIIKSNQDSLNSEYALKNTSTGTLTINSNTLLESVKNNVVRNEGELTITNSTIIGRNGISNYRNGIATINGDSTTVTCDGTGGSAVSNYGDNVSLNAVLIINGGTFTCSGTGSHALSVQNYSTTTINGQSTYLAGDKGISALGAENAVININNGTISSTCESNTYSCYSITNSAQLNIYGGTITLSSSGYTIRNSGTLTLGIDDENVSTTYPLIQNFSSKGYGIQNYSTVYFNDGVVKAFGGSGKTFKNGDDAIVIPPLGYAVNKTVSGGVESAIIEYVGVSEQNYLNTSTGRYYETLSQALNYVKNNETIKVMKNLTESETNTLASDKTITVDLNGYTLTGHITNNGSLTIGNGTLTGSSVGSNAITTYGTLSVYGNNTQIIGTCDECAGIAGYGTINITGGTIRGAYGIEVDSQSSIITIDGSSALVTADGSESKEKIGIYVHSDIDAQINILNGTVSANKYAIYSESDTVVTLGSNDGTVSTTSPVVSANNVSESAIGGTTTLNFYDGVINTYLPRTVNTPVGYGVSISNQLAATLAPGTLATATFYYNSDTTNGSTTIQTATSNCYYVSGQTCYAQIPTVVQESVGTYNNSFAGISSSTNSMLISQPLISGNTNFYSIYSENVTHYYYASGWRERTLYRNQWFSSTSSMDNPVLATMSSATTNCTDCTGETGPANSTWDHISGGVSSYSSLSETAQSNNTMISTVYRLDVNYAIGSNVDSIGATSGSCTVTRPATSCKVTLPAVTPTSGYSSVGWSLTNGDTTGVTGSYTLRANGVTLYANAIESSASKTITFKSSLGRIHYNEGSTSLTSIGNLLAYAFNESSTIYSLDSGNAISNIYSDVSLGSGSGSGGLVPIGVTLCNVGYTLKFKGWFTAATGGSQVLSASGNIYPISVSGYTSGSKWQITSDSITLYAQSYCAKNGSSDMGIDPGIESTQSTKSLSFKGVNNIDMIMGVDSDEVYSSSKFINTNILRNQIKNIRFTDNISNISIKDENVYDISNNQNESILLWVEKYENGYYDIVIGQNGGVIANSDSSYLFSYLNNLERITTDNFNTSKITNAKDMFYGCDKLEYIEFSKMLQNNVSDISLIIGGCDNLTTNGIKELISTIATLDNLSNEKTLKTIGLSKYQVSEIMCFDVYSNIISLGWKNGYDEVISNCN